MQGLTPNHLQDRTNHYAKIVAEGDQNYRGVNGNPTEKSSIWDLLLMAAFPAAVAIFLFVVFQWFAFQTKSGYLSYFGYFKVKSFQ